MLSIESMVIKYTSDKNEEWDDFVRHSKNGVFFFLRDYVEYHSDRFTDCSLMFYEKDKLVAVLPASVEGDVFSSHAGLSFGGMVLSLSITTTCAVDIFSLFLDFVKELGYKKVVYKCNPYIYHMYPSNEDLYSLYQADARLINRKPSAVIDMSNRLPFQKLRERGIKKAEKNKIVVKESSDYATYWKILSKNLKDRYKVKPTHSLDEILYLSKRFPENIKFYGSFRSGEMLGGVVMFKNRRVARAQYISTFSEGRITCALDILFDYLINSRYRNFCYFDFGVSTETYLVDGKLVLNENLLFQKEGFGSRSVMYDTYEINL